MDNFVAGQNRAHGSPAEASDTSAPPGTASVDSTSQHNTESDRTSDLQLEYKITTLCATLAATEYQFLVLLADYDEREVWEGKGTRSCAHWLNWRCGINMNAAREKLRVAHALRKLPKISDAFSKGHLSYSKVRAMTRIATPEMEESLLVTAEHASASHIEKLVRTYRRCETPAELDKELMDCNQRHYTRSLSHYWDDEGSLVIKATLSPEQGAVVLKALEAAVDSLREDEQFDPLQGMDEHSETVTSASTVDHDPGTDVSAEADNTPPSRQSLDDAGETPDKDVSAETRLKQQRTSIERQRARRVDALVLLANNWLDTEQHTSKNADRYQVVVNVDADILANRIRPLTQPLLQQSSAQPSTQPSTEISTQPETKPSTQLLTKLSTQPPIRQSGFPGQACYIDDMHALPADTVRRISCDCSVLGMLMKDQQPLSIGRKSRSIPPPMRRALVRRDRGCTFPGCCATRYVEGHHLVHWANGGETSLDNLALLCSHHHRLLHEGGFTVARDADGTLNFYDPPGNYIDPKQAQPDDIDYRFHVHRMQSHGIDEYSLWSYSGDRMDYDAALAGLFWQQ